MRHAFVRALGAAAALAALVLCPAAAFAQSSYASFPIATGVVSSALLAKTGSGFLAGANITSGASAGYVLVIDSSTVPADGAVTPVRCVALAANTTVDLNFRASPIRFGNGIVIAFSSTGCFTKTASITAYIAADVQ